jgi:hypothetical protein
VESEKVNGTLLGDFQGLGYGKNEEMLVKGINFQL